MPFAIITVTIKTMIINPIDVHLFSSMSTMPSKRNVAMAPAATANPTRNQNSRLSFLSLSLFSASFVCGSEGGELGFDSTGSVSGILPSSTGGSLTGLGSGPGVGLDFFFLNLAK